ncbi:MAG: pyridoxal phosphate-dependent aminotransferase [Synergistaceae bacterium]|nr:pyridoxal phosphate-dependent aminotransferase [Synergistaceae bacterium]
MKLKISKRAEKIKPSATLAVSALAREMKSAGRPVLSFSAGEPDFRSPARAIQEAADAMARGETRYTATSGIPELKAAIAGYYKGRFGLEYKPSEVIVTGGAKAALFEAISVLVDEGDEVLLPRPAWVSYVEQIELAGGTAKTADTSDTGFVPTKERMLAALSDKTVGIIINTPHNPTGAVYGESAALAVADIARERGLWVIYDEIYERLVYGGARHVNIVQAAPDIRDRVILINGVSKTFSMTGWRIGYALGPEDIIKKMDDIQSQIASNPSSISQWASVGAYAGADDETEARRAEFERRRDVLLGILGGIEGLSITRPDGAFYAFLDVRGTKIPDDMEFCRRLLEEKNVALVPGAAFLAPGFVRMSYACSEENIRVGATRIGEFIRGLA